MAREEREQARKNDVAPDTGGEDQRGLKIGQRYVVKGDLWEGADKNELYLVEIVSISIESASANVTWKTRSGKNAQQWVTVPIAEIEGWPPAGTIPQCY
jgi:hypothetical protein